RRWRVGYGGSKIRQGLECDAAAALGFPTAFRVPMHAESERRLSMNRNVGQAFQHAGLPDFPVRWTKDGRLESRPNPQAGKPALRASPGSWPQCAPKKSVGALRDPDLMLRGRIRNGA